MKNPRVKFAIMEKHVETFPKNFQPVPGFRGYFLAITSKPTHTRFDAPHCTAPLPAGASVLSTFTYDGVTRLKSWRFKKRGVEYGAEWVALRDNNGKKHHLKVEDLALKIFGEQWLELKSEIETNAFNDALGDLM